MRERLVRPLRIVRCQRLEPATATIQGGSVRIALARRLDQAGALARAVGLDMVQAGWKSTVDNYLDRVTKPRILEAVREAKGEASAQLIDHLNKADMARQAERPLDGAGSCRKRCAFPRLRRRRPNRKETQGRCPNFSPTTRTRRTMKTRRCGASPLNKPCQDGAYSSHNRYTIRFHEARPSCRASFS
jgi:hypothetical protein